MNGASITVTNPRTEGSAKGTATLVSRRRSPARMLILPHRRSDMGFPGGVEPCRVLGFMHRHDPVEAGQQAAAPSLALAAPEQPSCPKRPMLVVEFLLQALLAHQPWAEKSAYREITIHLPSRPLP